MRLLSLNNAGSKAFIIAADGLFSPYQPENDQVWALSLNHQEKYPISLYTTYGLRAQSMRLLPNVILKNDLNGNWGGFPLQPAVTRYTPDLIRINCSPHPEVYLQYNFFLPHSDLLGGNVQVKNNSKESLHPIFELAAALVPMGKGQSTRSERSGLNQIIIGQTGNLYLVLTMSGGPRVTHNPYPALRESLHLDPGQTCTVTWALASKSNREVSLEEARAFIHSNWQKTFNDHAMKHASQTIQIQSGQPDWDAAFSLSQIIAMSHLVSDNEGASYILRTRLPDQPTMPSYERSHMDDLTCLEVCHLAQVFLPSRIDILKNQIKNILSRVNETGFLPLRFESSDFIKPRYECPMLAQLILEIYKTDKDHSFLSKGFTDLCQLIKTWFQKHGSQAPPIPTWQDARQLQMDTGLFLFDFWEKNGKGLDIQFAESPALLAMLYREVTALEKMSEILNETSKQELFKGFARFIKKELKRTWQGQWDRYAYLDCQSQTTHSNVVLYQGEIQEELELNIHLDTPRRLQIHLTSSDEHTRVCVLNINGKDSSGSFISEIFKPYNIHWSRGTAHITSQNLYSIVESVSLNGLKKKDRLCIETANFKQGDITCLLPLWSGGAPKKHMESMISAYLNPEHHRNTFGIPETWADNQALPDTLPVRVNILWNTLIIEGLNRAGFSDQARALFSSMMSAIVVGLRDFHGFFPFFDNKTGKPSGRQNAIAGLAPLKLFLEIAGIRLFSPNRVALWGQNPFPWPIQIQWQGLSLKRSCAHTQIIFPDGTEYETDSDEAVLVSPKGELIDE